MIWIFTILGILIGAAIWGLEGAIVLGFIGWLAGVIVKSQRKAKPGSVPGPSRISEPGSLEERIARLEATVARLEARLGGAAVPGTDAVADAAPLEPVVPDAAGAAEPAPAIVKPGVRDPIPATPRPFA